jgi:hypothetical protein
MKMPVVFLYSDDADPFIEKVLALHGGNDSLRFVKFEQLVRNLSPSHWPVVVDGQYPSDLQATFAGADVINRVFNIDPDIVQSGLLRHGPHELWLHVITQKLLNSSSSLSHDIGTRGVSKCLLPLNTQWMLMSDRSGLDIQVPKFVLGFGGAEPDTSKLREPMQKSIWSYFDWKVENHLPKAEAGWHKFYVERPVGVPVICHYLGDRMWCSFPRGGRIDVDNFVLSKIVEKAGRLFKSTIGEVLVFVEEDQLIRFHAFSPHLTAAVKSEEFEHHLAAWITDICGTEKKAQGELESALA